MARRRRKRPPSGAEVIAAFAVLIGLLAFTDPTLRSDVVHAAVPIIIVVFVAGSFVALFLGFVRSRAATVRQPSASARSKPPEVIGRSKGPRIAPTDRARRTVNDIHAGTDASAPEAAIDPQPRTWSLELLQSLEWRRFEELCAGYFEAAGGFRARTTRLGADGGIDIYLYAPTETRPVGVVQCKAWNTYPVGVKLIRELYGVMAAEQARIGIFITTGEYTAEARAFADHKHLQLLNGEALLEKLQGLPASRGARLLEQVTAGDYTTPSCPHCGIKMVRRKARKDGQTFWGCINYPRCRQTLRLSKQHRDV